MISNVDSEIVAYAPKDSRHSVTIIGLLQKYTKDDIIKMLVMQNSDIKKFAENTNIKEHITIYAITGIKRDPSALKSLQISVLFSVRDSGISRIKLPLD